LKKNAAVYINSDTNSRGFLDIAGSHTLEKFMNEVARDVTDPEKKVPVLERSRAVRIVRGSADDRREVRERADLRIGALGSGSDYTSFLDHLGIASLNLGYGGEGRGGSYHSIYDSFTHFTRFIDPNFDYGIALSQTAGRTVLRLANADVLPLYFNNLSDTIERYVREVTKLADDMREETRQKNQEISNHTLEMVADPTQVYVVPKMEAPVPYLNFAPLQNSLTRLQESARRYDAAMNEAASAGARTLSPEAEKSLDEALIKTERAMTREQGLPRRPWFKHQIYAPGFYTGYGVKTLPGVREAIEQRAWKEANDEVNVVAETLDNLSAEIDRATNILKRGGR